MYNSRILLPIVVLITFLGFQAAWALELHVSPKGNDAWSGKRAKPNLFRTDGPFATLPAARDAARKFRAGAVPSEETRIILHDGHYVITEPMVFTPEDSGTEKFPVRYEAAQGARPVFSGGRAITGFQHFSNGIWRASVPGVAEGKWYFEQLFVNGKRAVRARSPNKFWYHPREVEEVALAPVVGKRLKSARHTIRMRPDDFTAVAGLPQDEIKDINLVVYHKWDNTRRFLDSINADEKSIITSGEGWKPWNSWRGDVTFILENYLRALDVPGEWFLARDGYLYYMPLPEEDMKNAEVVAPVAEKFLVIKGDPAAGK